MKHSRITNSAFVSPNGTPGHPYFHNLAALLEPDAVEVIQVGAFSYAISGSVTKYLIASYSTRLGASGRMEVRDPAMPLALRGVTITGLDSGASAIILDPAIPAYTDAWTTYYNRMLTLAQTTPSYLALTAANTTVPFLAGPYGALIRYVTGYEGEWVIGQGQGVGFNLANEISDSTTWRFANGMYLPVNKKCICEVRTSTNFTSGSVVYFLLPSTWSVVVDSTSYNFRDDFMGASLDTATKWNRAQSTAGNVEIDTAQAWCKLKGNGNWGDNGLFSQTSIARANGKVFMCDVYTGRNANSINLIVGFHDGAGYSYTDFAHAVHFMTNAGNKLDIWENGNDRGFTGPNPAWSDGKVYRVRITLGAAGAAKYEMQGGTEYPAIGGGSWTDVTPGTTSSATDPVYAGATINTNNDVVYVGDVKLY